MRFLLISTLLCISTLGSAQRTQDLLKTLDSLEYVDYLPKDLLSTKSLVLIKMPERNTSPRTRGNWEKIAEEAQLGFKKSGIDAVAYYYLDDVFSGPEVVEAFAEQFKERDLENLILIIQENDRYKLIIAEIKDKPYLIGAGQKAFKMEGEDMERMTHQLYLKSANLGLERTNLLVIEVPIYGLMAHPIEGRRGEYFDVNFASETLAVPAFADTSQINRVMKKYPFRYEIVDGSIPEKELRNKGYQYVLYYVHTTGENVKEILEYEKNNTETAYVTQVIGNGDPKVKSINKKAPVYKFYIKHIYSENVFLGTKWDADTSWWESLDNYVSNLKNQLVND